MLSFSAACAFRTTPDSMNQNPPFPTPEELQAKLSEFMKSNFGDKVSFATFAQPERAEAGDDEKPVRPERRPFRLRFPAARHQSASRPFRDQTGRSEKGSLDRGLRSLQPRQLSPPAEERRRRPRRGNRIRETERHPRRSDRRRKNLPDQAHRGADQSAVRQSRRDQIQRDRLRRRRCRGSRSRIGPESRRRRRAGAVRHHLHR